MNNLAKRYKPCGATECEYQEVIVPLKAEIERLTSRLATLTEMHGRRVDEVMKLVSQLREKDTHK